MSKSGPKLYKIPEGLRQEDKIDARLKLLSLEGMRATFKWLAKEFQKGEMTIYDFADRWTSLETDWKEEYKINKWIQSAKFPHQFTLRDYDFDSPTRIDKRLILELSSCRFIKEGMNVIFYGPTGVGKTDLAIAIGYEAPTQGFRPHFFEVRELIALIKKSKDKGQRLLAILKNTDLLILDAPEGSPDQVDPLACDFLSDLVLSRYEKNRSIIFTTTISFEGWARIFGDLRRAERIIDRISDHRRLIFTTIEGASRRAGDKMKAGKSVKHVELQTITI